MLDQSAIDNALVHMKDKMLESINRTYDFPPSLAAQWLGDVCTLLEQTRELFVVLSYGYKTREIAERVMQAVAMQTEKLAAISPRNQKVRAALDSVLRRATELRYH